ncbi:xanthine phosphoribosyltransferase [Acetobacterium paludosum]|uniref:Xanthine phosphoribosyltransferase n=1 Tax=Acetobacterium paludosum TaxID=52693 RepID=A0A923HZ97_9FIRM|nr:xanthine phosphoribosyltransferase [Acetobacterium paludosum]MBC3887293.1 xanthine phosphoribosyltransferase [Acetobacterium paludosum]
MELLEEKIRTEGCVKGQGILKVDSFLNHQLDVALFEKMGKAFAKRFAGEGVNKILTIESSGIAIATSTARYFDYCPVVFGKKVVSLNLDNEIYSSDVYSYTKQQAYKIMVSKKYINKNDRILIIDDFLANGKAVDALINVINQAGATLVGVGIAIEKGFQEGGALLRQQGIALESLAIVDEMSVEKGIVFRDQSEKK